MKTKYGGQVKMSSKIVKTKIPSSKGKLSAVIHYRELLRVSLRLNPQGSCAAAH